MPAKPVYDGDALKVPGAILGVSRNKETGEIYGLHAFTNEGTFIRVNGMWITATGKAKYQLNGSQFIEMEPAFVETYDTLDVKGRQPTIEQIAAGSTKGRPGSWDTQQKDVAATAKHVAQPEASRDAGVSPATVRRAWHVASRIVASRPWLEVSRVGLYDVPFHFVVHDGPYGAALHFDDDEGPTWEPRSAPEQELDWDDVEDVEDVNPTGTVDWVGRWGPPAPPTALTAKAAIYTLVAHLLSTDSTDGRWDVRPAKLVHYTDDSADAPDSAFSLTQDFSSLAPTVQWYVDQITSPSWGDGSIWHEPLWLITREDQPALVLDEAGQVHMTYDSLTEVLSMMATVADLGGIDDPHSFDLLDGLVQVDGDFAKLAALLRDGPGATLRAVKPKHATPTPAETPTNMNASAETLSGKVDESMTIEDRFPSACNNVQHFNSELLRWLSRTGHGATLGQSHNQIVTTVPIGEELCVLRGATTREGVADYLERTLNDSAFFVALSTKDVVHRVTLGREGRVRGFYLYTTHPYEEPRPLAAGDGSTFGALEIWFKLMDAVALLHARGHQRLRVISTMGDITARFNVVLAESIDGHGCWRHESAVLTYSMAQEFHVGNLLVAPDTPVDHVAREILSGKTDKGIGIDWAYAGWFAEVLAEARRLGAIPLDKSYFDTWALFEYQSDDAMPFPPPPAYPGRLGYTDVFTRARCGEADASSRLLRRGETLDVTKLDHPTALVASFMEGSDYFIGLFAIRPEADYRREQGAWIRYEKDDEIYMRIGAGNGFEDVLIPVSYRFIKVFDFHEAHGSQPHRSHADRMRVFSGLSVGPSGKHLGPQSTEVEGHGPDLITAKEIVAIYCVSLKTVQRWLNTGKLHPEMKLPGKTGAHLFTRAEAERAFGKPHKHE